MTPANNSGVNGYAQGRSDTDAGITAPIEDEVTRIEAVRHHAGVVGHGALGVAFLVASVVLASRGMVGTAVLTLGIAYGVVLNGVTAYAWDRLREYFASVLGDGQDGSTPLHVPPNASAKTDVLAATRNGVTAAGSADSRWVSWETRVELLATTVLAGGVLAALGAAVAVFRLVGVEFGLYLFAATLAVGILGAFGVAYRNR